MIIATYRKACACNAGAHPGRIRLDNVRVTTITFTACTGSVPYDVPMADLVLDPAPSCDRCLKEWEEVKA